MCLTFALPKILQTPFSVTGSPINTVTTSYQDAYSQFLNYLGMPTCVPGTSTETMTGSVPTLPLNTFLSATDSRPQTTGMVVSTTNTSVSTTTTISPQTSSTNKPPTDLSRGVKIGNGVAIPIFIIALLMLGIFLRRRYQRGSQLNSVHEGPATHTQTLETGDQQPFLQLKAELEAKERHELEAVEIRHEIQGAERRLEVSAGEFSQELAVPR